MTGQPGERGLALVVALWVVAALALIAAAMLSTSLNNAHINRNAWEQLRIQTAADSGVQSAILSLFDPKPQSLQPLDGGPRTLSLAGISVTVSVQDETGRIDLNYASRTLLRDFFKVVGGVNPDSLADHVIDWRSPGPTRSANSVTADDYRNAGYAYRPRGGPFQSVDELGLVMGVTPDLLRRAEPSLTVYSHISSFDTRFAPADVLQTIPGVGQQEADQMVSAHQASTATEGHAYSIISTATRGRMRSTRRAVVLITGDPKLPYWILDWR